VVVWYAYEKNRGAIEAQSLEIVDPVPTRAIPRSFLMIQTW